MESHQIRRKDEVEMTEIACIETYKKKKCRKIKGDINLEIF